MGARLKTKIWVDALLRRAQIGGAGAFVVYKGDPDAGIVFVKISTLDGRAQLYTPVRDLDGALSFRQSKREPDRDIDQIVRKQRDFDADIWLIEIEDKSGQHFLTEEIETMDTPH